MQIWAGLILAVIAGALFYIKRVHRVVCILVGVAGVGFAAVFSGWIMAIPTGSTTVLWTTRIFGLAGLFGAIVFIHDVLPKTGSPRRWQTPIIGLLFPAFLLIGIGGVVGDAFKHGVVDGMGHGIDAAVTTVFGSKGR
ncbi:hypothetical protein [Sphaerisporangium fuscum]|uniref:hypothetical protein n=1 Tax=Sphaerisporangium fuscum TaxID=2835868 RepID=UPI001BDBB69B|nr:hypothetical protein [Sphaerisporangium fuscum]